MSNKKCEHDWRPPNESDAPYPAEASARCARCERWQCQCGACEGEAPTKSACSLAKDRRQVKLPRGWRRIDGVLTCSHCVAARYRPRSIRLQLLGPAAEEQRTKQEMYTALAEAGFAVAGFANWYVQQLYVADEAMRAIPVGANGKRKLPPAPEVDYYARGRALFPGLAPQSLSQAAQSVRGWYCADRGKAFLSKESRVRNFRWDELPIAVHRQAWTIVREEEGDGQGAGYVLRIAIGAGESWRLKVFADNYNRTYLAQVVAGDAIAGAAHLVRRRRAKRPGESQPPPKVWLLRISALIPLPRRKRRKGGLTLELGHDADAFLFGSTGATAEPWIWPGLELRDRVRQSNRIGMAVRQELALARRSGAGAAHAHRYRERLAKNRRWIDQWSRVTAADVARRAAQAGVDFVEYHTADRGFLPNFPYYRFRAQLQCALENAGIGLVSLDKSGEPIATGKPNMDSNESMRAFATPSGETEAVR